MPAVTTANFEQIALDGPMGLSLAVALGLALLGLFAWLLWQERRILGGRTSVLFWLLRSAALATVIWMLLAPARIRVETTTTRRAVSFVTDVSGSMRTIDPPGAADDARWATALRQSQPASAIDSADRAVAALGVAWQQLQRASLAVERHRAASEVVAATAMADKALKRTRGHLQSVLDTSDSAGKSRTLARRVLQTLDNSEFQAFEKLAASLDKGRTPAQQGWRESLPDLAYQVAGLSRNLEELARLAAEEESAGMAQAEPMPRLRRVAKVVEALEPVLKVVRAAEAEIRMSCFSQTVNALSPGESAAALDRLLTTDANEAATAGTNVTALLEQLERDRQQQPLAAVFVFSDLAHNVTADGAPQDAAKALTDTPIYVVPIGNTEHVRDVVLAGVHAPTVAMRNDDIVVEAHLRAFACQAEVCTVELLEDGRVVDFRELPIDSDYASRVVRFERQVSTIGNQKFQIAVTTLDGELTTENNFREFDVNVTRSDIKLLLADALPRWEYRYLAQLFRRDPKVQCDELLFQPRTVATGRRAETQMVPMTAAEWDHYDLVLLGDLTVEQLPAASQQSLVEYVQQRGGTLVVVAGQQAMPHAYADDPLAEILPVQSIDNVAAAQAGPFDFRITKGGSEQLALMIGESEEATRAAWDFVNRFSPLQTLSRWRKPKPSAHTFIAVAPQADGGATALDAAADTNAFLCWQPVGRGRVVYLAAPDTYRLRFLRGDRLHYRFWGQLLRWAIASELSAGDQFVRLRSDKSRYETQEPVRVSVWLSQGQSEQGQAEPLAVDSLQLKVMAGEEERVVPLAAVPDIPGKYRGEIRSLAPGVYRMEAVGPAIDNLRRNAEGENASASFTVYAEATAEMADTRCDLALAQQIATLTGGQVLAPAAVGEILSLTDLKPVISQRTETRPLWLEWKYLWLVFGCLQLEWGIRKWRGLS